MRTTFAPAQRRIQNPPLHAFLNLRGLLISRDLLDHIQRCNHQGKADHEHNQGIADESGDQVGDEGNSCNGDDVGQLRGDMGDMLTLCTGGSHDRRIGDRGAVVAADSAGHAGGDGDNHQLRVGVLEHCNNDRDQDTKGSPAGSGGKGEERTDQEDDGRQERHQVSSCLADGTGNKIRSAETVGHGL